MKKTTINGKRYIALGDFDNLRRNLMKDILESYEKRSIHLNDFDRGVIDAYSHIMTVIMEDELDAVESPEEVKAMYKRIRQEWMDGKFLICGNDQKSGDIIYFRKYCGEDGDTPTFTTQIRKAMVYDDYYYADCALSYIKNDLGDDSGIINLRILSLEMAYMDGESAKKLLDAIFGKDDEGEEE